MTKVNKNDGNETKSDIFSWDIFKSDAIFFLFKKNYCNGFQNQNFSMEMKQNQTFFHGTYSNLTSLYFFVKKY